MMKNKALLNVVFCLIATSVGAYDAFDDKLQRPTADKQDVEKITRPTATPLQSADIKDYRDKLSSVQSQMFKDGVVPKGASLQADNTSKADTFRVQAPFSQFSESAQTQILTLKPEAKNATAPLALAVTLDKGVARIDSVKVPMSASVPKFSVPGNVIVAPNAAPGHVAVASSFRPTAAQPVSKTSQEPVRSFTPMALPDAARLFVGKDATTVRVLDGPMKASENSITRAFLPTSGKESIIVHRMELNPAAMGIMVTVSMPGSSVPAALVERITEDKPEALPIVSSGKNAEMTIGLLPNASFTVLSVEPSEAQTSSAKTGIDTPPDVRAALSDLNTAAPIVPKAAAVSNAEFLKVAQQLAGVLEISPAAIVFETPSADPAATAMGPLAVATHADGNAVLVQPVRLPTGVAAYVVEGRMTSFSNTLQAEIRSRLEASGDPAFVTGNPELIVESRADTENGFDVMSIALAPSGTSPSAVMLWKSEPTRAAGVNGKSSAGVVRSLPIRVTGVAPAANVLIKTVFGEKAGQISFQNAPVPNAVRFVSGANDNLAVRWIATDRGDRQSFLFVGKPVEFTDAIRNGVKAQIPDDTARKDSRDIQVEFLVDQSQPTSTVKVIEAGPSPREVAEKQAEAMGLSPRDYLLVDIGARFLIVIDRGQSISIPGSAANVRLKSPDGNLTLVANPRQTKADTSVLLIFSRLGLKTNWTNLVRLAGGNIDEVVDKTLRDNPRSDQFLVRLFPDKASTFIVRPLNPSTAALLKPGNSKP